MSDGDRTLNPINIGKGLQDYPLWMHQQLGLVPCDDMASVLAQVPELDAVALPKAAAKFSGEDQDQIRAFYYFLSIAGNPPAPVQDMEAPSCRE